MILMLAWLSSRRTKTRLLVGAPAVLFFTALPIGYDLLVIKVLWNLQPISPAFRALARALDPGLLNF